MFMAHAYVTGHRVHTVGTTRATTAWNNSSKMRQKDIYPVRANSELPSTRTALPFICGLDVEYIHVRRESSTANSQLCAAGKETSLPAYVALVDRDGRLLYKSYILPDGLTAKTSAVGGVPLQLALAAPSLQTVQNDLLACIMPPTDFDGSQKVQTLKAVGGHPGPPPSSGFSATSGPVPQVTEHLTVSKCSLLVGHGLMRDLQALGPPLSDHFPPARCYDTMTFSGFQGKGGTARSLRRLAETKLGLRIQTAGLAHDPEEDARAAVALFVKYVEPMRQSTYEDMVDYYTQLALARASITLVDEPDLGMSAVSPG